MANLTVKRYAKWIDVGLLRFSLANCVCRQNGDSLIRISTPHNGHASLYRETAGGWILAGFTSSEPLTVKYISMCEYDRLTIVVELNQ